MDLAADLPLMFDDFGVPVEVNGAMHAGLFDDAYADALGLAGSQPVLLVQASAAIAIGVGLTVQRVAYTVRGVQPDGNGLTRLLLERD